MATARRLVMAGRGGAGGAALWRIPGKNSGDTILNAQTSAAASGAVSSSFCYDPNGNLTADGSSVYLYDAENRLVERRVQGAGNGNCAALGYGGAVQAALRYDPLGRLFEVSGAAGLPTRFLHDGDALVAEFDGGGTVLRRYVHGANPGADDPLLWYEGSTIGPARWLHRDWQGSVIAIADASESAIAINRYDEYGIPQCPLVAGQPDCSAPGANQGRFQYTGQAWLAELGMYYYKARIYSPTLGRFLQTDPIGYEDQVNLYGYVGNDPVGRVDPTGSKVKVYGTPEQRMELALIIMYIANSDPVLRKRFDEMESSKFVFTVRYDNKGEVSSSTPTAFNPYDAQNGVGSGAVIIISPKPKLPDGSKSNKGTTTAHELFSHAYDQMRGVDDPKVDRRTGEPTRETRAVNIENIYRRATKQELRECWSQSCRN